MISFGGVFVWGRCDILVMELLCKAQHFTPPPPIHHWINCTSHHSPLDQLHIIGQVFSTKVAYSQRWSAS